MRRYFGRGTGHVIVCLEPGFVFPSATFFVTTNQYFLNKRANLMGSSTEHILTP